jgi:hypothetical protein
MGVSVAMVVKMMSNAGMGENSIIAAFDELKPIATYEGGKYYDPNQVSRYIKRNAL